MKQKRKKIAESIPRKRNKEGTKPSFLNMRKILVSIDNLNNLPSQADGYVLGYEKYTFFAKHRFSFEELEAFKEPRKIYLLLNVMLHEKQVEDFRLEAEKLSLLDINFIVQDLGMVGILKRYVDASRIIYNPYTLVCNLEEFRAYKENLGVAIGVSSQLSLDNLEKFKGDSFITLYGYVPIYQSYRKVISLYSTYHEVNASKETLVKEATRDDKHHIIENEYGSVIFSSEPVDLVSDIERLKDAKYLFIDTSYVDEEKTNQILEGLHR